LTRLKQRLARLARAQLADLASNPASNPVSDTAGPSSEPSDGAEVSEAGDLTGATDCNDTPSSK
jgi:hypothetical protein